MKIEKCTFSSIEDYLKLPQLCEAAQWKDRNGCMLIFSRNTVERDRYQLSVFENNEALFHVRWSDQCNLNVIAILPTIETEVTLIKEL